MLRRRFRVLSEDECRARLYGGRRLVEAVRTRPRTGFDGTVSGEELRRLFEVRLDSREQEAA